MKRHIADQLPAIDSPSLFGMTADAEMTYMEDQAQKIISTVLSVQPNLAVNLKAGYVHLILMMWSLIYFVTLDDMFMYMHT